MDVNTYVATSDEQADRDLALMHRVADAQPRASKPVMSADADTIAITDSEGRQRKQVDILVDIGQGHELFHDPGRTAYASVRNMVLAVDSRDYREVLAERFLSLADRGANRNSIGDAIATLTSIAKFRGQCHPIWLRTAAIAEHIAIDTGSDNVIMIGSEGVKEQPAASVRFRRTAGMLALPKWNEAQPDFARIWKYLNVCDEHRPLVAGFMLAALRPTGPYPILFLGGEQGTGKSTATRVIRRLIDPSTALLRAPPKDVRDLLVAAYNCWLLALDNLSYLTPQLSDALCRLATGGAISERALYSNTDEVLIEVQRPVIVNGIEDVATRPDLAERGLHIELDMIRVRQSESDFWRDFDKDAPAIFAGLLDGLVQSVSDHRRIDLGPLPRMADFAKFAAAGMQPLGFSAETFINSYRANLETGLFAGFESSLVGRALVRLVRDQGQWKGTTTELLTALSRFVEDSEARSANWPKSPRALSGAIRRLAPALRLQGLDIERPNRTGDARHLLLCERGKRPSPPSPQSPQSPTNDGSDEHGGSSPALHAAVDGITDTILCLRP